MNRTAQAIQSGNPNPYRYNGKELQTFLQVAGRSLEWYDYGARFYEPAIGRWQTIDPLTEKYYSWTPYNYTKGDPINRIDVDGLWDVKVHVYKDRSKYGYGYAMVTDKNGNEIYRLYVRVEGIAGHNRKKENADTPLGVYDIPDDNMWKNGGDRGAYGPNYRLILNPESGEIDDFGRDDIRMHGGRQEIYNKKTKEWEPASNPSLSKTKGCIRALESDMIKFKQIIDDLKESDPTEKGGKLTVSDDLQEGGNGPIKYTIPGANASQAEKDKWINLVNDVLKGVLPQ